MLQKNCALWHFVEVDLLAITTRIGWNEFFQQVVFVNPLKKVVFFNDIKDLNNIYFVIFKPNV